MGGMGGRTPQPKAMAAALALLAGALLPCFGGLLPRRGRPSKSAGARCSHHDECFSDCCLMDLDHGGAFCVPKARRDMVCLPQTKGATNIVCPCQLGLRCIPKDPGCPRRCQWI